MRRFTFKLQSILNIRERKLEDERHRLAEIIAKLEEQKDILLEMNEKKESLEKELNNALDNQVLDVQFTISAKNYLKQMSDDIKMQFEIIKRTQNELNEQKIVVAAAYKEVKILEKLKEKQYKNFMFEYEQNQIKEMDDITSARQKKVV